MTRRDYQVALNLTGAGVDDPDANFYQNYKCGSPRNYSDYCSEEIDRLIDQQSQMLDLTWPFIKNLVHNRMQEVWLDK